MSEDSIVPNELKYGKTKILCTLGPASSSIETLTAMMHAGMDVARLNFSHGTHGEHREMIQSVRRAAAIAGEPIAILQDLQGPKIRTGKLTGPAVLNDGAEFIITTTEMVGNAQKVSTTYTNLPADVKSGDTILMDDGLIQLSVLRTTPTEVVTRVVHGGLLKEHKGINLPRVKVSSPSLTEKDKEDLLFGIAEEVDFVALSFVRSAEDIRQLRTFIIEHIDPKRKLPIIAKIEKGEALDDIDEIIHEADALMVARGDLGVEIPTEDVPRAQKMICKKANTAGKPVIIATQMLESMIENARPTRAEANDVANAVLDGADAVMLSGETSVGKFVVGVVQTMDTILRRTEEDLQDHLMLSDEGIDEQQGVFRALARSACVLAQHIQATAIVVITHTGATAREISRYRPGMRIVAVTDREKIQRRLNLVWGVRSMKINEIKDTDATIAAILDEIGRQGYVKKGDCVVITAGIPLLSRNSTNMIKVEKIA